ncbi:MAG: hypothetical protein K2X08_04690 [Chlamydiales bacterium]|nr:hypothetical protein [Chlamydiales bacterium]
MRKVVICFVLSILAIGSFNVVHGDESKESDAQLMCDFYHKKNATLQEELDVRSEKIYIEPYRVLIVSGQIFAYLNEWWELVGGLHTDEAGLYVFGKEYHPNCPPNFQKPVCLNVHTAIYKVHKPSGEFYRFLCERHGCDYQYHTYVKKFLPPGYYVLGITSGN